MSRQGNATWKWLAAAVLAHLVVSIAHGAAHAEADVTQSRAPSPAALARRRAVLVASPAIARATGIATTRDGGEDVRLTSSSATASDAGETVWARRAMTPTRYPARTA